MKAARRRPVPPLETSAVPPLDGSMPIGEKVRQPMAQRLAERDGAASGRPRRAAWRGPERRVNVPPVVLIVDDEPDQLDVYRQGLEFAGYRVAVAGGGRVALDMALAAHPDVIIMDLAMPGMNGFEATRRIKELKATRDIPVIALSAAYGEIPPEWAQAAGCETYLPKPILPQELSEQIEHVIARAKRRALARSR
jgi:two-component system, cell cycle response regulator DivK